MVKIHDPEVVEDAQTDTDYDADSDLLPHYLYEISKLEFTGRHTTYDQCG